MVAIPRDPPPGVPGLRTLGTGGDEAAPGNDPRFAALTQPGVYDVTKYGARTNGSDPNHVTSNAFIAAHTDCVNAGGGTIYMPPGTYGITIGGQLLTAKANMNGRVVFKGAGRGVTTIRLTNGAAGAATLTTQLAGAEPKAVPAGLTWWPKQNTNPLPAAYDTAFPVVELEVDWSTIQPSNTGTLDASWVTTFQAYLDAFHASNKLVRLRIWGECSNVGPNYPDTGCPAWLKASAGTFKHQNGHGNGGTKTLARFWDASYIAAYDNLMKLLAALWDTHPALGDLTIFMGGLTFMEPDIRDLHNVTVGPQNRAELVGGGIGWDGTNIDPPGAGYSDALSKAAMKAAIDSHATWFTHTCAARPYNPFATLTDYNTYSDADNFDSDPTMPNTQEMVDYLRAKLGRRAIYQNNSVQKEEFTWSGGTLGVGTPSINPAYVDGAGVMYQMIVAKNSPRIFQTGLGSSPTADDYNAAMECIVTALAANGAEPGNTDGSGSQTPPFDAANQATWNQRLLANPLPAKPNNDLTYTTKATGTAANATTMTYAASGANQPLTVTVSGTDITVHLATDGSGNPASTANQVLAAINATTAAKALVTVALATGSNGTGIVTPLAQTHLAGGYDTSASSGFLGWSPDASHPEYRNYAFEDFTLNGQGMSSSSGGALIEYVASAAANPADMGRHEIRRVDGVNLQTGISGDRRFIHYNISRSAIGVTPVCRCHDLIVEDVTVQGCDQGINLSGFVNTSTGVKDVSGRWKPSALLASGTTNPANVEVGPVWIRNFSHDTMQTPLPSHGGNSSLAQANIQTGGDGITTHARISGGVLSNSADVGIEIDGGLDVDIEGVTVKNSSGHGYYILPYAQANQGSVESYIRVRSCRFVLDAVGTDGVAITDWNCPAGFCTENRFGAIHKGKVLFEDCLSVVLGGWSIYGSAFSIAPARSATIRSCKSVIIGAPTPGGGGLTCNHLRVYAGGQRMTLNVDDFDVASDLTADNVSYLSNWVALFDASALRLNINGVSGSQNVIVVNGGHHDATMIRADMPGGNIVDNFSQDLLDAGFVFDAGASSDYVYDGTNHNYAASVSLATEKRAIWIATNSVTNPLNHVGTRLDGGQYFKYTTGASLTGYKAGVIAKRDPDDATTYLEGYVFDDGANSYLCVDRILAGVRTTLLPVGGSAAGGNGNAGAMTVTQYNATPAAGTSGYGVRLQTRLATATAHWPRLVLQGNTLYADHFTAAPTGSPATVRPATGAGGNTGAYVTITLTGTDVQQYGAQSRLGYVGLTHIPIDAAALLDDATHQQLHVLSGAISRVYPGALRKPRTAIGYSYVPGSIGVTRIDGELILEEWNLSTLGPQASGTPTEFNITADPLYLPKRRSIVYYTPQAATTITPSGSPFAWQNQTGSLGTLFITAGTVSLIELSKDGTTYRTTGLTTGALRIPAGWYARVTYSSVPTMIFEKED